MLRGATAAILTLLVSSLGAYCEGARVLMPAVDSCTVEDDNQWTAQERFVWRHVCAGEVADFNEGSIYGGNLDPERSAAWPANRVLTPAFLQAILLEDKYRRLVTRHGVRIVGARFTEAIELANAELKHELWLDKSLIEKGGTLSRLRSTEPISFEGSNIGDWLDMTDIRVEAGLSMRESRFTEISLIRARVGKFLEMRRSVIGRIEMSDLQVDGNLWMDEAKFDGLVGLDAKVRGDVSLTGARAAGPVFMDRLQVGGSLLMDEAEFGGVRLVNARVGGYLDVSRSKVADDFMAEAVGTNQTVFLGNGAEFNRRVILNFAKIKGNLNLAGGTFRDNLDITNAQIEGIFILRGNEILKSASLSNIVVSSIEWGPDPLLVLASLVGVSSDSNYIPALYDRLAKSYADAGQSGLARSILIEKHNAEFRHTHSGWQKALLFVLWALSVYGYRPEIGLLWIAGFVIIGAIIFKTGERRVVGQQPDSWFVFALDSVIPAIHLNKDHDAIRFSDWRQYFLYFLRFLGAVLIVLILDFLKQSITAPR